MVDARSRTAASLSFLALAVLAASCDPYSGLPNDALGVRFSGEGDILIEYIYCPRESLERVQVIEVVGRDPAVGDEDDRVLWEIVAIDGARQRPPSIKIGEAPNGFDETVPAAEPMRSDARYAVSVDTNDFRGILAIEFRLDELQTDRILSGGRHLSEEEFAEHGKRKCRNPNLVSPSDADHAAV